MSYIPQSIEGDARRMEQLFGTVYSTPLHPPFAVVSQIFKRGWAAKERFGRPEAPVPNVSRTPRRNESLPLAAFATANFLSDALRAPRQPASSAPPAPPEQDVRASLAKHWQRFRLTREYSSRLDFLSYLADAQALFATTETKEFGVQEQTWQSDLSSPGPSPKTAAPGNIYRIKELQKGDELRFSFLPVFAWIKEVGDDWAEAIPLILLHHPGPHEPTRKFWEEEVARARREDGAVVLSITPTGKTERLPKWTAASPLKLFQRDRSLNYIALPRFACRFHFRQLRPRREGQLRLPPAKAFPREGWCGGLLRQQMAAALETSRTVFDERSEDAGFWVQPEAAAETASS